MVIEAMSSLPDDDDSDDPGADAVNQISLDNFVKPADWPEDKNWGTLTIDASCTPAEITYPTDLKLLNEARESTERIIDDLCDQHMDFRKHRPRYDRGKARAAVEFGALARRASAYGRLVFPCAMALPSCTGSSGIHTIKVKT
jgi:hypothetical protein